ncbi:MAG: RHS repeat-associated core domain-containing protein, partial [Veillonellaceae bacterium]|nr:RHS repeat-associated core domain-containing protein [Veillonellaceae bacterium]
MRDLYYYVSRWYDPVVGRFLQEDAVVPEPGNPQSLNRYAYVLNNPLRYT